MPVVKKNRSLISNRDEAMARVWAACANSTDAARAPRAVKTAAERYLRERDDVRDDRAMERAIESMHDAARKTIIRAVDGRRFLLRAPMQTLDCSVRNGRLTLRALETGGAPPSPLDDISSLIQRLTCNTTVFPFRRCSQCNRVFARRGRQLYCSQRCTRDAERERRRHDEQYKERHKAATQSYRARQRKKKAATAIRGRRQQGATGPRLRTSARRRGMRCL